MMSKKMNRRVLIVMGCAALASAGVLSKISMPVAHADDMKMDTPGNIIQVATGPGMEQVTTLVTAVKAAGLVDALEGRTR